MKRWVGILCLLLLLTGCAKAAALPAWQEQYDLGLRYLSEGNYQEAILAFNAAIEIDPKRPDAYLALADTYIAAGDLPAAMTALQEGYNATGDAALGERLAQWPGQAGQKTVLSPYGNPLPPTLTVLTKLEMGGGINDFPADNVNIMKMYIDIYDYDEYGYHRSTVKKELNQRDTVVFDYQSELYEYDEEQKQWWLTCLSGGGGTDDEGFPIPGEWEWTTRKDEAYISPGSVYPSGHTHSTNGGVRYMNAQSTPWPEDRFQDPGPDGVRLYNLQMEGQPMPPDRPRRFDNPDYDAEDEFSWSYCTYEYDDNNNVVKTTTYGAGGVEYGWCRLHWAILRLGPDGTYSLEEAAQ